MQYHTKWQKNNLGVFYVYLGFGGYCLEYVANICTQKR